MSLRVLDTDMLARKVSIYLRRRNARMTEQFLHMPEARTTVQQVSREAVPQHVWADFRRNPGDRGEPVEPQPERLASQPPAPAVQEQGLLDKLRQGIRTDGTGRDPVTVGVLYKTDSFNPRAPHGARP